MDRNLALEVVRVTEAAALGAAREVGKGDEVEVDVAASTALEKAFRSISVDGRIVIGEGVEDDGIPLYEGQRVGTGYGPGIQVSVDAVEGPTACASGGANALSVIAISDDAENGFLACPPVYMDKIAVGPEGRGVVDLDDTPSENLKALANAKGVYVADLTVAILDRPRHEKLIAEVRASGARIRLIPDGDLSAALATTRPETGIDVLLGIGRAHQGVLAAAALECTRGFFQGRFVPMGAEERDRLRAVAIEDETRKLEGRDLVRGDVMFAATGITDGNFLRGVRFFRGGATTNSIVMRSKTRTVRVIEATHYFDFKPVY